ncbi:hypothetical protein B0H11DRAFT_857694 [Mycena galericulata]|nr:hypothetical protein B0H11DRAFT_857694 [Mycena galericulata]
MLQQLNTDVLLSILCLTDVYTIVSLSRVNKLFYSITSAKQLWVAVLRDLSSRRLSDLPSDTNFEPYTTDGLINEVKRAVLGPCTWSPHSRIPPTIHRHASIELTRETTTQESFARWLPGGRHIFFYSFLEATTVFECWEVHPARKVWAGFRDGHVQCVAFDFRPATTVVSVCFALKNAGDHMRHIVLLGVDLSTGRSCELFRLSLDSICPVWDLRISGDCLAWTGTMAEESVVLVNWRSGKFIAFPSPDERGTYALSPAHIVLAHPSLALTLQVYPLTSLESAWRPLSAFNWKSRTDLSGVPAPAILNIAGDTSNNPEGYRFYGFSLEITACAVRDGTYDLVVVLMDSDSVPQIRPRSASASLWSLWGWIFDHRANTHRPPTRMWKVSRYHLVHPPTPSPPTLLSIQRQSASCCQFVPSPRYAVGCTGMSDHRTWLRRHSGQLGVHRAMDTRTHDGTGNILTSTTRAFTIPGLHGARACDVQVSELGGIMICEGARVRMFYFM